MARTTMDAASTGAEMIAAERGRQVTEEGYTADHDIAHPEQMALAGAMYAMPDELRPRREYLNLDGSIRFDRTPRLWPWHFRYWKPTPDDRVRELVKAGALIAAEIDRIVATEATR